MKPSIFINISHYSQGVSKRAVPTTTIVTECGETTAGAYGITAWGYRGYIPAVFLI
jgi:hypothetical protein